MILFPSLPLARNSVLRFRAVRSANAAGGGHIRGGWFKVKAPPQTCGKLAIDETRKWPEIRRGI
jgi:hypothetical protein